MYEAIVGPTFQLILKEAVKIPSIDRLVNQTDLVCLTLLCCTSHSNAYVVMWSTLNATASFLVKLCNTQTASAYTQQWHDPSMLTRKHELLACTLQFLCMLQT